MTQRKNHIKVSAGPNKKDKGEVISGSVNFNNILQKKCENILKNYEAGEKNKARIDSRELQKKYPDSTLVKQLYTLILYKDGRYDEAYASIQEILARSPNNAGRLNLQGLIQRQLGLFEEAIESYQKAIRTNPHYSEPYNNMAIIYRYYGKKSLAIETFRQAIKLNPDYPSAIYNLSCMQGFKANSEEIKATEKLLTGLNANEDKARCHFSLYNAYQSIQEQEQAFRHLQKGNKAIHTGLKQKKPLSVLVEEIKADFDHAFFDKRVRLEPFYKTPFFIVGMPRSGSSLLEQMLASHSKIYGLGESRSIPQTLFEINRSVDSSVPVFIKEFSMLNKAALNKYVEKYKARIQAALNDHDIYTDKMLKNFKVIGFIKILLPNAKFIHIKRQPLDNCFACFEKKFTRGHEYTYDLNVLGSYFVAYTELMEYWKLLFPDDIYELQYEELVHNTEVELAACLDFMGLKPELQCLEFYNNERSVFTASTDQVREKINTRSIGKWLKFEAQLQPLIKELQQGGVKLD